MVPLVLVVVVVVVSVVVFAAVELVAAVVVVVVEDKEVDATQVLVLATTDCCFELTGAVEAMT